MSGLGAQARGVIAAGFEGRGFDANLPQFGAYVLFARNVASVAQTGALTAALRGDGLPPLIAIDQEGGRVARVREGVEPIPSMMALGAAGDLDLARQAGEQTAFDLRRCGCTLDFAPVLDVAVYPENTAIGTRSFGSDPHRIAALGGAFCEGLERGGVAACGKHFPGHGATPVDSHAALPVVDADAALLRERDLIPFAALASRIPAIMGTHAIVRAFDPDRPATFSRAISSRLLREELGFTGVLVTDCLQMSAVASGEPGANAVAALCAGADLLTVSHSVELALEIAAAIERAVGVGTLAARRLQEASDRVARLRAAAARCAPLPDDAPPPYPGVGRTIARRAITLVRGAARVDPAAAAVVSFDGGDGGGIGASASVSLRRESPALEELRLPLDPQPAQVDAVLAALEGARRRPLLLARRAHLHPAQARAIARLTGAFADAVAVSMLEPYDIACFGGAQTVLAAYGDDAASIGGLADVLFGGSPPEGHLPIDLPA